MCERKTQREAPVYPTVKSLTSKRTKYPSGEQGVRNEQTRQAPVSEEKLNDSDICLATADTAAKCQSILMGNLG